MEKRYDTRGQQMIPIPDTRIHVVRYECLAARNRVFSKKIRILDEKISQLLRVALSEMAI